VCSHKRSGIKEKYRDTQNGHEFIIQDGRITEINTYLLSLVLTFIEKGEIDDF